MSDIEEPPSKVTKYEMSQTFTQEEELDEGQEEWLSEELLTDEDCNAATEQDRSSSALENYSQASVSQDNTNASILDSNTRIDDSNIEETLNSFDSEQQNDLPSELNKYLVRKAPEIVSESKAEESDGNDTDDLLRMLEDDDEPKKKKTITRTKESSQRKTRDESSDDDDDDFVFEGKSAQKLKVAKSVLMKKYPASKAPEDSSDSEESSIEEGTQRKSTPEKRHGGQASRGGRTLVRSRPVKVNTIVGLRRAVESRPTTVARQKTRPRILKAPVSSGDTVVKQVVRHVHSDKVVNKTVDKVSSESKLHKTAPVKTPVKVMTKQPTKAEEVKKPTKVVEVETWDEPEEIIDEAEFLDEEGFDLDEKFAAESDSEMDLGPVQQQRIMNPERMDEDMMSDVESLTDDDFFNDFPSSESDMDDWFTLDLRSERAGDYIPLLGAKAYELLLEEKERVSLRVDSLKESVAKITENGRRQAEKLKVATEKLAEIDDMLKAA